LPGQLAHESGVDGALTRLLDALIEVVRADKGFVLEVTEGAARILKARNFQRENVADAVEGLSDTIVKKVLETRQPLRIEDALHDAQFQRQRQRGQPQAASVLCLPLVMRGELLGAIYLGNDKLTSPLHERELRLPPAFAAPRSAARVGARPARRAAGGQEGPPRAAGGQAYGDIIGAATRCGTSSTRSDKVAGTDIGILVTARPAPARS